MLFVLFVLRVIMLVIVVYWTTVAAVDSVYLIVLLQELYMP